MPRFAAAARSIASARAPRRWISLSFGLASIKAASIAPRRKMRISASLPLRRSSFADIGISDTPSPSCRPSPSAWTRAGSISSGMKNSRAQSVVISPGPEIA